VGGQQHAALLKDRCRKPAGVLGEFAATLVAATTNRRREFARQRLIGSPPPEVLPMIWVEDLMLVVLWRRPRSDVSLATIVPYRIACTGGDCPGGEPDTVTAATR
jgi:hypothetical protein